MQLKCFELPGKGNRGMESNRGMEKGLLIFRTQHHGLPLVPPQELYVYIL